MTNPKIIKAVKFFALALPLIFIGPSLMTPGFAQSENGNHLILIISLTLCLAAITLFVLGLRSLLSGLFDSDK